MGDRKKDNKIRGKLKTRGEHRNRFKVGPTSIHSPMVLVLRHEVLVECYLDFFLKEMSESPEQTGDSKFSTC